jgi:WD40 repeat protein
MIKLPSVELLRRVLCRGWSCRAAILLCLGAAFLVLASSSSRCLLAGPADKSNRRDTGDHAQPDASAGTARDLFGDPLPAGAVLRLGTIRLRHASNVLSVAFSPNGETLATVASLDPGIQLWDVQTGRLMRTLLGSVTNPPQRAVFSPNGARLAAVCRRGGVQLWDVGSGLELREASEGQEQQGPVAIAFAPDGRHFAAAGFRGAIRLWDADNSGRRRLLVDLGKRAGGIQSLAFSPDGKLLAYSVNGDIRLLNAETGAAVGKIEHAHEQEILNLAFGLDGKTLFSAGDSEYRPVPGKPDWFQCDPRLRIWDVATGKVVRDFTHTPPETGACTAALSRDGHTLASRQKNSLLVWDVATGQVKQRIANFWLPAPARDKPIHDSWAFSGTSLAISPDATRIASVNAPLHTVTIWDAATGRPTPDFCDSHAESIAGLACSPDGTRIVTGGGRDGTVRLWDSATGKTLRTFVIGDEFPCEVRSVAFSPDGKSIVAGGPNSKDGQNTGIVRIWDVETGAVRLELRPDVEVSGVAFSHDGSRLAIATSNFREFFLDDNFKRGAGGKQPPRDRTLLIVDSKTGAERQRIKLGGYVKALAFSKNGASVGVVAEGRKVSSWDVGRGELRHESAAPAADARLRSHEVCAAAIADDGSLAAMSLWSSPVATLWDLSLATQVGQVDLPREAEGFIGNVLAISLDKRVLASASVGGEDHGTEKQSIRLWDLHTGRLLKRFARPLANRVKTMVFTPDGKRLISGMSDGTCLIWDVSKL